MKSFIAWAGVFLLAAVAYAGEYPDITLADLKAAIEAKKVTVIDVNGTKSWKNGHIPTAINYETNKEKLASLLPKGKDALVVAYCGSPRCRAYKAAAKAAVDLGYTNVKHFSGGISGWEKAGETMEKGE